MPQNHIRKTLIVCAALIALALAAPQAVKACGGGVICVDKDATGTPHNGLTWTTAYTNVQDALAVAAPGNEIWVAEGVYYPDEGVGQTNNAVSATFALRPGVAVYGGFNGTETAQILRDPSAHRTLLSGDIDKNDVTDAYGMVTDVADIAGANAYHVITGSGVTATARLDGFIVTAGYITGDSFKDSGGGMYVYQGNPTLNGITFSGNYAEDGGGGLYIEEGNLTLTNIFFSNNQADEFGGGMNVYYGAASLTNVVFSENQSTLAGGMEIWESDVTLANVVFDSNRSVIAGGLHNYGPNHTTLNNVRFNNNQADGSGGGMRDEDYSVTDFNNVSFTNNRAGEDGGGLYSSYSIHRMTNVTFSGNQAGGYGGGLYNDSDSYTTAMTNCILTGNYANYGGGMYLFLDDSTKTNFTISGNHAAVAGGGIYNEYSYLTLVNSIVWGNTDGDSGAQIYNDNDSSSEVTYSIVQGGYAGTGNLDADPRFVAPIAATAAPTTTGDYRLLGVSPAIDAGAPATCPDTDLRGELRDDLRCDMGAYEFTLADGDTVARSGFAAATPYSFGPTLISVTLAAADSGSITATRHAAYPGGSRDAGEVASTWWISSSLTDGFPLTLSLCYRDADVTDLNENTLEAFRWVGGTWVDQNATPDPERNCVSVDNVAGFSAWTLKDTSVGAATPTAVGLRGLARQTGAWPLWGVALLALGAGATFRTKRKR